MVFVHLDLVADQVQAFGELTDPAGHMLLVLAQQALRGAGPGSRASPLGGGGAVFPEGSVRAGEGGVACANGVEVIDDLSG